MAAVAEAAIVTEDLTKSYHGRRGIVDVALEVRAGEVFGFLGPNGAGKTTTIRLLLDLIRPTAGRARVLGLDVREGSLEIRRRVGYLPGELALWERMTGAELLAFLGELRGGVDRRFVAELAERLDCDLSARIGSLSHGSKQKVALIQAFLHRPELLILDEPTTGLDPLMQEEFQRMVAEVRAEGRTVFLSSHILREVERTCDRVGIVREGRLVAVEDVRDLRARGLRILDLRFAGPVPASAFQGLPGVQEVEAQGDGVRLTVAGPVDAVVKAAARHEVVDLTSHEPSLEEIFLRFYGGDDGA
jgi:ABC-2 type transport system ATP-binding protein